MDLSDLNSTSQVPDGSLTGAPGASEMAPADAAWRLADRIGIDIACTLTPALDSVRQMQATGRIDRSTLQALIAQIDQARSAGMRGQQIARLAQGGVAQQPETRNLSQALRDALGQRQDDLAARGVAVRHAVEAVEVVADPTLLSTLLETLLDWGQHHARTPVDIALDIKAWPAHARLACRFGHTLPDQLQHPVPATHDGPATALDDLSWHLLTQLARTMSLTLERTDTNGAVTLTLEFPHTVNGSLKGATSIESSGQATGEAQPLAGTQLLLVALRREVVNQVQQALAPMGMQIDWVGSVNDARAFCQRGLPAAIVYESMLYDSAFDRLRSDVRQQCPELAWVEIVEQGDAFEISSFGGMSMARVGRDAIADSLPSALMFELSRGL